MKTYKQFLQEKMTEQDIMDSWAKLDAAHDALKSMYRNESKAIKAIATVRQETKKLKKGLTDRESKQRLKEIDEAAFDALNRIHHVSGTKKKLADDEDYVSIVEFLVQLLKDFLEYVKDNIDDMDD